MLNRLTPFLTCLLAATLLGACATTMRSSAADAPSKPDCSYRSATTCWTVAGRFPPARRAARDSLVRDLFESPPRTFASHPDTSRHVGEMGTNP
jgi:hypothetical protein